MPPDQAVIPDTYRTDIQRAEQTLKQAGCSSVDLVLLDRGDPLGAFLQEHQKLMRIDQEDLSADHV